jgi:hypothetical protein
MHKISQLLVQKLHNDLCIKLRYEIRLSLGLFSYFGSEVTFRQGFSD